MTQTTLSGTPAHAEMVHIPLDQLQTLAHTVLLRLGLSEAHAGAMARVIVAGQRDACQSHGVYRLTSCATRCAPARWTCRPCRSCRRA